MAESSETQPSVFGNVTYDKGEPQAGLVSPSLCPPPTLLHVLRTSHVLREKAYIVGGGGHCCTKCYLFIYIRPSSVILNIFLKFNYL